MRRGAAERFKEGHSVVGVPMFILGVAAFGLWLGITFVRRAVVAMLFERATPKVKSEVLMFADCSREKLFTLFECR